MFIYTFYWAKRGGHTHVRLFAGNTANALGKCGDLCFRNEEWTEFKSQFRPDCTSIIHFVEEL